MKSIVLIASLLLLQSAIAQTRETEERYIHRPGYFESKFKFYESEFSDWHVVSDMQRKFDRTSKSKMWIYQEGRNHLGVSQIRWIKRKKSKNTVYNIRGMLDYDDFYNYDMKCHADGYRRVSMQVFVDASGIARHQAVWVKRIKVSGVAEEQSAKKSD